MLRGLITAFALCACACSSGFSLASDVPGTGASARSLRGIPTSCIVVAPFERSPQTEVSSDVSELLGAYLVESLNGLGIRVIPPADAAPALAGSSSSSMTPREQAQQIAFGADREFGCNVVVTGRIDRFRDRSGEALGSTLAASVAFDLRFFGAPGGETLWEARFDETQKALTENLWRASKYPGGGTRWLSANEFARFGLDEVVSGVPFVPRAAP